MKKNKLVTEDGRMAEKVIRDEDVGDSVKRVTEVYVEPKPEKKLHKRVVEYTKPVVHKRDVEVIDEETGETRIIEYTKPVVHRREYEVLDEATGEIIEKKIDTIPFDEKKAFKKKKPFDWRKEAEFEEKNNYVTKEDLHASMVMLAELLKKGDSEPVVSTQSVFMDDVPQISAQSMIEDRINKKKLPITNIILWSVISIQIALLGFLIFKMVF